MRAARARKTLDVSFGKGIALAGPSGFPAIPPVSLADSPFAAEGPAPGQRRPLVVSSAPVAWRDVGCDALGLVAGEQLGRRV